MKKELIGVEYDNWKNCWLVYHIIGEATIIKELFSYGVDFDFEFGINPEK